ncbi:MAG TPA: GDSL-type esterase/lipase family protein [Mobilitalea sp.]|nr:GDSL-type esterase/lipase family protein [Mobilitalea sp.]
MYHILCFGDSNTYGFIAGAGGRYDESIRWTRLLQKNLGEDYYVIEEGLNGRSTVFEDPYKKFLKGIDLLEVSIASHNPIDLVILMLGTNDVKADFKTGPKEIRDGLECLIKKLRDPMIYNKAVLIVSPIHIRESIVTSVFCESFGGLNGVELSKKLAPAFKELAKQYNCDFLDAAEYAVADDTDAIHLDAKGHAALAAAFYNKIKEIQNDRFK